MIDRWAIDIGQNGIFQCMDTVDVMCALLQAQDHRSEQEHDRSALVHKRST
jgi:hypothetical protein